MWIETLIKYIQQIQKSGVEDAWSIMAKIQWRDGRQWIKENMSRIGLKGDDAESVVELVRLGLQTLSPGLYSKREFNVVEASPEKAVIEITAWCPVIDAAKKMKLDAGMLLEYILIPRLQGILQSVNPKLNISVGDVDKSGARWSLIVEMMD